MKNARNRKYTKNAFEKANATISYTDRKPLFDILSLHV